LLLVAMGVVAMRAGKSGGEPAATIAIPATSPPPSDTGSFAPLPTNQPTATSNPTAAPTETTPVAAAGGTPGATATPTAAPTGTPTSRPTSTSTGGSKPPSGGDACEQCENAARSGNLSVAASLVAKCADAEKKKSCISRAK